MVEVQPADLWRSHFFLGGVFKNKNKHVLSMCVCSIVGFSCAVLGCFVGNEASSEPLLNRLSMLRSVSLRLLF